MNQRKLDCSFMMSTYFCLFFQNNVHLTGSAGYINIFVLYLSVWVQTHAEKLPKYPRKDTKKFKKKSSSKCGVVSPIGVKSNQPIYTNRHVWLLVYGCTRRIYVISKCPEWNSRDSSQQWKIPNTHNKLGSLVDEMCLVWIKSGAKYSL